MKHGKGLLLVALSLLSFTAIAGPRSYAVTSKTETNSDGTMVRIVNGVPKNVDIARLTQKAEMGDTEAQSQLAMCLYDGEHGVPPDHVAAYKWATLAASKDQQAARTLLRELEVFMTPKDVEAGKAAAKGYLESRKVTTH